MAELRDPSTIVVDNEPPLSVRRTRRIASYGSAGFPRKSNASSRPLGISTPPQTPKRGKKRVRFSESGPATPCTSSPSSSSGLTPFIRRTSLTTPTSKRRHSTPATLWNRADFDSTPFSGTLQFAPLRQVLDGRVQRRIRRHRLSEETNIIEGDKRQEAKTRKYEVEILREQLAAKDLEVQRMREEQELASQIEEETGVPLSPNADLVATVHELEQEIQGLREELQRKETQHADWIAAAGDPFNFNDNDEEHMITNYDYDFTMNDEMITTPTRLNTSFLSPPSTTPNTPSRSVASMDAGIQVSTPIVDPENEELRAQLETLRSEIAGLTSTIAVKDDHHSRLSEKLSEFVPQDEAHDFSTLDAALDKVLTELALSQSHALDRSHAFSALTADISSLGFPAAGPEVVLETIAQQFRQARLDLEYLTPGEVVEGFENDKLLGMLISRIRVLVDRVKAHDDSIDQYHQQELLLRQQLNSRVETLDAMKKDLLLANMAVDDLKGEMKEQVTSNQRLQAALDGYRDEVKSLEKLIERMEEDGSDKEIQLRKEIEETETLLQDEVLKHDVTRADNEGKDLFLTELERRLNAALLSASEVQAQLKSLSSSTSTTIAENQSTISQLQSTVQEREKAHGAALALRDARVSELRQEIDRINNALKTAHSTILSLRNQNQALGAKVEGEKSRGRLVVQSIRDQLSRALETGMGYVNGDAVVQGPNSRGGRGSSAPAEVVPGNVDGRRRAVVVRKGGLFDGGLARRTSGSKKRRRYDSGMGFLEEEDEMDLGLEVEEAVERAVNRL